MDTPVTIDDDLIYNTKAGLMGALAGIGDSIDSGTIQYIFIAIALPWAQQGNAIGALFPFVMFSLYQLVIGYYFAQLGFKLGRTAATEVVGTKMQIIIEALSILGLFMMGIPEELSEAARIDGAGELKIYSQIVFPMCKPGLATLVVFTFNFMWNDYMAPMIYLTSDKLRTIQIGLASFRTQYGSEYGLIMAGTVCALIPMLLIFIVGQKYLVEGIAFSGLKG